MKGLTFSYPWILALLPVLIIAGIMQYRKLPGRRMRAYLALRFLCLMTLVAALSCPMILLPADRTAVIFLVDCSAGMGKGSREWARDIIKKAAAKKKPDDRIGVVLFGREPYLEKVPGEDGIGKWGVLPPGDGTDIAPALTLAVSAFPDGFQKRVVLLSDGRETTGSAVPEAAAAASMNIEIWCLSPPEDNFSEALVESLETPPASPAEEEPFLLRIRLHSTMDQEATLKVTRNGKVILNRKLRLREGENLVPIPQRLPREGIYRYEAYIFPEHDRYLQNNRGEAAVVVAGKPGVLYITTSESSEGKFISLLARNGIRVVSCGPESIPSDLAGFLAYQAVIVSDTPSRAFSQGGMDRLRRAVEDLGVGFLMFGGPNSYGAGGYHRTPIADILPVNPDPPHDKGALSLLMVVDSSSSMAEASGEQADGAITKLDLARQAALETLKILSPTDRAGVLSFSTRPEWVAGLRSAGDMEVTHEALKGLRPGGGTRLYPALRQAVDALAGAGTPRKHLLVLSDGKTEPGEFGSLLSEANRLGITLSAVAVGQDSDRPFLSSLARRGKGRYYYASSADRLPRIFTQDALLAAGKPIRNEPFRVKRDIPAPLTDDFQPETGPGLSGMNRTSAHPASHVLLSAEEGGEPLLVTGRAGLGSTAAFTADDRGVWTHDWEGWEPWEKLKVRMVREILRTGGSGTGRSGLQASVESEKDKAVIKVWVQGQDGTSPGQDLDFLDLAARISPPKGDPFTVRLPQSGPEEYTGSWTPGIPGTYIVYIDTPGGGLKKIYNMPYSGEYRDFSPDTALLSRLAELTGGIVPEKQPDFFAAPKHPAMFRRDAAVPLVLLALLLLAADLAVRRVTLPFKGRPAGKRQI